MPRTVLVASFWAITAPPTGKRHTTELAFRERDIKPLVAAESSTSMTLQGPVEDCGEERGSGNIATSRPVVRRSQAKQSYQRDLTYGAGTTKSKVRPRISLSQPIFRPPCRCGTSEPMPDLMKWTDRRLTSLLQAQSARRATGVAQDPIVDANKATSRRVENCV